MSELIRKYEQLPLAQKAILFFVIVGLSGFTAWEEFVTPKLASLEAKQEEQSKLERELSDLNRDFVSPVSMEEELAVANREYRRLVELLPQDPSIERVLNDFASISRLTGTEIREFTPSAELTPTASGAARPQQASNLQGYSPGYVGGANAGDPQNKAVVEMEETNAIGLQIKMLGSFASIASFLDAAMNTPRVVRIQDFEIVNSDKDFKLTQKPKLNFNGLFYAYFQKANKKRPDQDATPTSTTAASSKKPEISKPAVDLNDVIDNSFSAKPLKGGQK